MVLFFIVWALLGAAAQAWFMIHVRSLGDDIDWDGVPGQLIISLMAGPLAFLALFLIIALDKKDESDDL